MAQDILTMKQEEFCQAWIDENGNGTQAALRSLDITNKEILEIEEKDRTAEQIIQGKKAMQVAASISSEYLRIPHLRKRIDVLLDERGFTDEIVKQEHFKIIKLSKDETKMRAIDSYYKLKGKIIDKSEVKLEVHIDLEKKKLADEAINQFINEQQ